MRQQSDVRYIQYGINGNLACQPVYEKQAPPKKKPKQAKRKVKRLYVDPLALGGIAVAAVMLILMFVGMSQLRTAEMQTERLRAQVDTLQQEHENLLNRFDESVNLDLIREQAESLGLVPVDQVTHITVKAPVYGEPEEPEDWERFNRFLVGLFA